MMSSLTTKAVESPEPHSLEEHSFVTDQNKTQDISNSTIDNAVLESPPPLCSSLTEVVPGRYSFTLSDRSTSPAVNRSTMECDMDDGKCKCILILVGILVLLPTILLPLSFSDLQYYEVQYACIFILCYFETSKLP